MKKHIFIILFLLVAIVAKAQVPYEQYSNGGISLDFKKIENLNFRVYLMYHLQQDRQFSYMQDVENGVFLITSDNENNDFGEAFDNYYYNRLNDFNLLSKNEIDEQIIEWKNSIASVDMTFILIDWFLIQNRVDNDECSSSLPFCTSETITFEAANTSSTAHEPGMDDGCIGSSYNPSFYHMRIRVGGQFIIHMEGHDPNTGYDRDIDFCMWGPYTEEEVMSHSACSNLSSDKIIDCCYSADEIEDCYLGYTDGQHHHNTSHGTINYHVPEVGEYYILMITNFSQQPCVISFLKTPDSGPGETDCGILPGIVTNDGPYCDGETIQLDVNEQPNGTYQWTGPDGWTSTLPHPTRENATVAMSGTYSCTTTVGAESTTATTEVIVNAMPDPNPSAQPCVYGSTTTLNVDPGVPGTFTYHWEPEDMVANPDSQSTETVMLTAPQEYTVTVTNASGDCTASADFTVTIAGSNLTADVTVDASELCEGESTTLHAIPHNGTGRNHFNWSGPDGFTSTQQNVQVTPAVGTTRYTCIIDDELTFIPLSVDVTVHPNKENPLDPVICEGTTYEFHGHTYTSPGHYTDSWTGQTKFGCDSVVNLDLTINPNYPDEQDTISGSCNRVIWHGMEFTHNGDYRFDTISSHGCDSIVTLHVRNMEYTPTLDDIQPIGDEPYPHWVVPATEFQINTYHFKVKDLNPNCTWENVKWTCEGAPNWIVKSEDENNPHPERESWVAVTVIDRVEETVWLTAHVINRCTTDTIKAKYFLVCSFYDTDEQNASPIGFNVVPNPNNGEMRLSFENLTGKIGVKVYDMSGNLIDNFETHNDSSSTTLNSHSMSYSMKRHAPGIYYFVATAKEGTITKKVVVMQ